MSPFTRAIHRDEEGATVVIVALSLIALFGMLVLVIDVGGLLYKRREMVNGADAAALAAAQTCSVSSADDPSDPRNQANTAAQANVPGLTSGNLTSYTDPGCRTKSGYVTVNYSIPQNLFFAPVLGFGQDSPVAATATAAWGTLGAGKAVPIVLESSQFQGPCDIPDGVTLHQECNFWYDNGNFAIGDANWGFLNLDQWGVDPGENCNAAGGAADRSNYILYNFPNYLPLKDPGPTYVCSMTGHATSNWQDLIDRMNCDPNSASPTYANCPGSTVLMPVNDCSAQIDKNGNVVPCGTGTPDKFAIIGFTSLKLFKVLRGDDPAAIGTPGIAASSGTCGTNGTSLALDAAGQRNLGDLADLDCGGPDYLTSADRYHVPYPNVVVSSKSGSTTTTYVKCTPTSTATNCDYRYNEDNTNTVNGIAPLTLQWVNPTTRPDAGKTIEMTWSVDGTAGIPGYCGIRQPDPNALCIVTTWEGFTTQNAPVGSGPDTGTRGFVLCDFAYDSCPAGVKP